MEALRTQARGSSFVNPWNRLIELEIIPSIIVELSNPTQAVLCTLTLLNQDGTPGYTIGGKFGPGGIFSLEPSITVYDLIVGYRKEEGGLFVKATVTFGEQEQARRMYSLSDKKKTEKPTEVDFPFPLPADGSSNFRVNYFGLGTKIWSNR